MNNILFHMKAPTHIYTGVAKYNGTDELYQGCQFTNGYSYPVSIRMNDSRYWVRVEFAGGRFAYVPYDKNMLNRIWEFGK